MTSAPGTFEMEKAERDRLEVSVVRHPLSLLEARYHPQFGVSYPGALAPGMPGDVLFIRFGSEEFPLSLDAEGRIVQILWAGSAPFGLRRGRGAGSRTPTSGP